MQEGGVNADSANISKNRHDMIVLGFDLMEITSQKVNRPLFQGIESGAQREVPARAQKLAMKVGLSSGPAAGIVLGRCRRFYCIYGPSLLPIFPTSYCCIFPVVHYGHANPLSHEP